MRGAEPLTPVILGLANNEILIRGRHFLDCDPNAVLCVGDHQMQLGVGDYQMQLGSVDVGVFNVWPSSLP